MIDIKELDLSKCTTNKEVLSKVAQQVKLVNLDTLIAEVNMKYVFHKETVTAVYTGLSLGMNVYIYGPGGYGKTEVVQYILKLLKIPNHTISGYKDMPVEALLGVPDMRELLDNSKYKLNFNDSVFRNPGILLGEEFGDILPATAASLKDILSDRGYRSKDGRIESLISSMIITSNVSPAEMSDDESKKAFYTSRFPLKVNVGWESHTAKKYFKLLSTAFPEIDKDRLFFLAKLFEYNAINSNNVITPRHALEITTAYEHGGLSGISAFDLDISEITRIIESAGREYKRKSINENLNLILVDIEKADKMEDIPTLAHILARLEGIKIPPENIAAFNTVKSNVTRLLTSIRYKVPNKILTNLDNLSSYGSLPS